MWDFIRIGEGSIQVMSGAQRILYRPAGSNPVPKLELNR